MTAELLKQKLSKMPTFPLGPLFLSVQTVGLRGVGEGRGGWMGGWTDNEVTVGVEEGRRREYPCPLGVRAPGPLPGRGQGMAGKETRPANYTPEDKFIASHPSRNGLYLVSKGMTLPQEHFHRRKNKN